MQQTSSSSGCLLDTHVWVKYINGTPGLKPSTIAFIEQKRNAGMVFISVISVWEIAMLVRKGRLALPMGPLRWVEQAMLLPGVHLLPLTPEIAVASVDLPSNLNNHPSDRILVASSQLHQLSLVTRDKDIVRFAKHQKVHLTLA